MSPPVVDSSLPSPRGTHHRLSLARSTLVHVRSTLPHPRSGATARAHPSAGPSSLRKETQSQHSATHLRSVRGRRARHQCGRRESARPQAHRLSSPVARSRVFVPILHHVGPLSSLDWLLPSMEATDLSAIRGPVSNSHHLGYPPSLATLSSRVLPLQTMLLMLSDAVARSKSERSFAIKRWAWDRCYRCLAHDHQDSSCKNFCCNRCRRPGHRERHCRFRFPLLPVELTPLSNVTILNNRGLGLR